MLVRLVVLFKVCVLKIYSPREMQLDLLVAKKVLLQKKSQESTGF